MEKLESLINELESTIQYLEASDSEISKSSVGWHIEHTLLTINSIIKAIEKSKPEEYKRKFSFAKLFVFTFNKIPRGRIQAPNLVQPNKNFLDEDIRNSLRTCYELIKKLPFLKENNFFEHPFFGHLNLKASVKFLQIHTKHHLNIINDILNATKK